MAFPWLGARRVGKENKQMHYILHTLAAQQSDTHVGLRRAAINDRKVAERAL